MSGASPTSWPGCSIIRSRRGPWASVPARSCRPTTWAISWNCMKRCTTTRWARFRVHHGASLECSMMPPPNTSYRRFGKRALDVLLSVSALVVLSPLLLVIALSVRFFLGSPVLFRQRRSGVHRQSFTILKFRTMTDARDGRGDVRSDTDRLTLLGRWLAL